MRLEVLDLISSGRLFQVLGAATRKARDAATVFVLGTTCQKNALILSVHCRPLAPTNILADGVDEPWTSVIPPLKFYRRQSLSFSKFMIQVLLDICSPSSPFVRLYNCSEKNARDGFKLTPLLVDDNSTVLTIKFWNTDAWKVLFTSLCTWHILYEMCDQLVRSTRPDATQLPACHTLTLLQD